MVSRVVGIGVGSDVEVEIVALEMVTRVSDEVVWFPVASRAVAVRVCGPSVAVVVFQVVRYGLTVTSPPKGTPSRRNWTPVTPVLSEAVASRETEPEIVKPDVGEVRVIEGGVSEGVGVGVTVGVGVGVRDAGEIY